MPSGIENANHALLTGQIAGLLMKESENMNISDVEVDIDENGDYTNHIIVYKPSGSYQITVEPLAINPDA